MAIDKEYWKKMYLVKGNFPDLVCPFCNKGHLKPTKDGFKSDETKGSWEARDHDDWDPMWIEYRFSLMLKCNYDKCKDVVVCVGKGFNEPDMEYDSVADRWDQVFKPYYEPLFFYPALRIIPLRVSYSKELTEELTASFSHFFSDLTSCANKIRICIEILMDELNIKKSEIKGGKRRGISLHSRILEYKTQNAEVADYLLAIKWIGNSGSHYDKLSKDDILDAYTLLDYSLNKIHDNDAKEIKKLSKEINKRKAPRSKKRKASKKK